ncbi:MAG: DUF4154 domain-containing protein [Ignavibacteriae bacterium]|nr:DUF4154 domain-containing protein [Ignavibacteriota bacterium]
MKLIPKVLSLDKNFSSRKEDQFNLAVLYSSVQRNSSEIKDEIKEKLKKNNMFVKTTKVIITFIDLVKTINIEEYLKENKIDVVYITPLRGVDINSIANICKEEKALTVTGVLDFMENEISVSFDIKDKKLQIIINNDAAKLEGTNFSSRLLRIAKII